MCGEEVLLYVTAPGASLSDGHVRNIRSHNYYYYTNFIIIMSTSRRIQDSRFEYIHFLFW